MSAVVTDASCNAAWKQFEDAFHPLEQPIVAPAPVTEPFRFTDGDVFEVDSDPAGIHPSESVVQLKLERGLVKLYSLSSVFRCSEMTEFAFQQAVSGGNFDQRTSNFGPEIIALPQRMFCVCRLEFSGSTRIDRCASIMVTPEGLFHYPQGGRISTLESVPRILRILSHFFILVAPDGRVSTENRDNFGSLLPVPPSSMIDSNLWAAIRQNPRSLIVRGMVRNLLLMSPPESANTSELIEAWVHGLPSFPPTVANWNPLNTNQPDVWARAGIAGHANTVPTPPREETSITLTGVEVRDDVSGNVSWTRRDTYTGDMEIPMRIARQGADAIRDYVRENFRDDLDQSNGEESIQWETSDTSGGDNDESVRDYGDVESVLTEAGVDEGGDPLDPDGDI